MNKKKIFLAAPISSFQEEGEYFNYRKIVLRLIEHLRENSFYVFSELEFIRDKSSYDSPEKSVRTDFKRIRETDIFILMHPNEEQTSALIELGYAYAHNKKIIVVGSKMSLPYLLFGLTLAEENITLIDTSRLNEETFSSILNSIKENGK